MSVRVRLGSPGRKQQWQEFGVELGGQGDALGGFSNDGIE